MFIGTVTPPDSISNRGIFILARPLCKETGTSVNLNTDAASGEGGTTEGMLA
jgi:hypothetical protein